MFSRMWKASTVLIECIDRHNKPPLLSPPNHPTKRVNSHRAIILSAKSSRSAFCRKVPRKTRKEDEKCDWNSNSGIRKRAASSKYANFEILWNLSSPQMPNPEREGEKHFLSQLMRAVELREARMKHWKLFEIEKFPRRGWAVAGLKEVYERIMNKVKRIFVLPMGAKHVQSFVTGREKLDSFVFQALEHVCGILLMIFRATLSSLNRTNYFCA